LGKNIRTLSDTVNSNKYWIERVKKKYGIDFNSETWVITEEEGYIENKWAFEQLERLGVRLVVVPIEYVTLNNTLYKARALHYATELREKLRLGTNNTWVYHQDEETMIGEDTVLGILDFTINNDEYLMGSGIILYPQNWTKNYLSIQETTRSVNDMGLMGQIKHLGYSEFGYHGSHFIIRADVEEKIGWDFGLSLSEDLLFSIKVKNAFGKLMTPLKGFVYEKPPFTFSDQQRQRKRWVGGGIEILERDDVDGRSKVLILYGLLSWLSAFPSIIAAILNIYLNTGGIVKYGGFIAGFIWFIIFYSYKVGSELHSPYVESDGKSGIFYHVTALPQFLAGILSDAIGPWNAILFPSQNYDCIQKDKI
jgi:cellulose synthase/poly-beta-1,6-N-acetylglucosamine synthase-like glycosyltransferase